MEELVRKFIGGEIIWNDYNLFKRELETLNGLAPGDEDLVTSLKHLQRLVDQTVQDFTFDAKDHKVSKSDSVQKLVEMARYLAKEFIDTHSENAQPAETEEGSVKDLNESGSLQEQVSKNDQPMDDDLDGDQQNEINYDAIWSPQIYKKHTELMGGNTKFPLIYPKKMVAFLKDIPSNIVKEFSLIAQTPIQYIMLAILLFQQNFHENIREVITLVSAIHGCFADYLKQDSRDWNEFQEYVKETIEDDVAYKNLDDTQKQMILDKLQGIYENAAQSNKPPTIGAILDEINGVGTKSVKEVDRNRLNSDELINDGKTAKFSSATTMRSIQNAQPSVHDDNYSSKVQPGQNPRPKAFVDDSPAQPKTKTPPPAQQQQKRKRSPARQTPSLPSTQPYDHEDAPSKRARPATVSQKPQDSMSDDSHEEQSEVYDPLPRRQNNSQLDDDDESDAETIAVSERRTANRRSIPNPPATRTTTSRSSTHPPPKPVQLSSDDEDNVPMVEDGDSDSVEIVNSAVAVNENRLQDKWIELYEDYRRVYHSEELNKHSPRDAREFTSLAQAPNLLDTLSELGYSKSLRKVQTRMNTLFRESSNVEGRNRVDGGGFFQVQLQQQPKARVDLALGMALGYIANPEKHRDMVEFFLSQDGCDWVHTEWSNAITFNTFSMANKNKKLSADESVQKVVKQSETHPMLSPIVTYMFTHSQWCSSIPAPKITEYGEKGELKEGYLQWKMSRKAQNGTDEVDHMYWLLLMIDAYLSNIAKYYASCKNIRENKDRVIELTTDFCSSFCILAIRVFGIPPILFERIREQARLDRPQPKPVTTAQEHDMARKCTLNLQAYQGFVMHSHTHDLTVQIGRMYQRMFGHGDQTTVKVHALVRTFHHAVSVAASTVRTIDNITRTNLLSVENLMFTAIASLFSKECTLKYMNIVQDRARTMYQNTCLGVVANENQFLPQCIHAYASLYQDPATFKPAFLNIAQTQSLVEVFPKNAVDILAQVAAIQELIDVTDSKSYGRTGAIRHFADVDARTASIRRDFDQVLKDVAKSLWILHFAHGNSASQTPADRVFAITFDQTKERLAVTRKNMDEKHHEAQRVFMPNVDEMLDDVFSETLSVRAIAKNTRARLGKMERQNFSVVAEAGRLFGTKPMASGTLNGDTKRFSEIGRKVLERNPHLLHDPDMMESIIGALVNTESMFTESYDIDGVKISSRLRPIWEWDIKSITLLIRNGSELINVPELEDEHIAGGLSFFCGFAGPGENRASNLVWFRGKSNAGKTTATAAAIMMQCAFRRSPPSILLIPFEKNDFSLKQCLAETGIMCVSCVPKVILRYTGANQAIASQISQFVYMDDVSKATASSGGNGQIKPFITDGSTHKIVLYYSSHGDASQGGHIVREKSTQDARLINGTVGRVILEKIRNTANKQDFDLMTDAISKQHIVEDRGVVVRYVARLKFGEYTIAVCDKPIFRLNDGKRSHVYVLGL